MKKIIELQRDYMKLVSDVQVEADAEELDRRKALEKSRDMRQEQLENLEEMSQKKLASIYSEWSLAEEKTNMYELKEVLDKMERQCLDFIEYKMKVINDLQRELMTISDCHVEDIRKHEEVLDQLIRKVDQINAQRDAYLAEADTREREHMEDNDNYMEKDKREWAELLADLHAKQKAWLMERQKTIQECKDNMQTVLQTCDQTITTTKREMDEKLMHLEMELDHIENDRIMHIVKEIMEKEKAKQNPLPQLKRTIIRLQAEREDLKAEMASLRKAEEKKTCVHLERKAQQCVRVAKQVKNLNIADNVRLEDMWKTLVPEVKALAEKALEADSRICGYLGMAWARPVTMERVENSIKKTKLLLSGKATESVEEVDAETRVEITNQLYNELQALNCRDFGLDEDDWHKFAKMVLKRFEAQQSEDGGRGAAAAAAGTRRFNPNDLLPAFHSFLNESVLGNQQPTFSEVWDTKKDAAFWNNMANIVSQHKLDLWDEAETMLTKYLQVLQENSDLMCETQALELQNAELQRLMPRADGRIAALVTEINDRDEELLRVKKRLEEKTQQLKKVGKPPPEKMQSRVQKRAFKNVAQARTAEDVPAQFPDYWHTISGLNDKATEFAFQTHLASLQSDVDHCTSYNQTHGSLPDNAEKFLLKRSDEIARRSGNFLRRVLHEKDEELFEVSKELEETTWQLQKATRPEVKSWMKKRVPKRERPQNPIPLEEAIHIQQCRIRIKGGDLVGWEH